MPAQNPSTIYTPIILLAGVSPVQYKPQIAAAITPAPAGTTPAPTKTIGQLWPR
jgi:hypothetical protein